MGILQNMANPSSDPSRPGDSELITFSYHTGDSEEEDMEPPHPKWPRPVNEAVFHVEHHLQAWIQEYENISV